MSTTNKNDEVNHNLLGIKNLLKQTSILTAPDSAPNNSPNTTPNTAPNGMPNGISKPLKKSTNVSIISREMGISEKEVSNIEVVKIVKKRQKRDPNKPVVPKSESKIKPKNKKSDNLPNIMLDENMANIMSEFDIKNIPINSILGTLKSTIMTLCGKFSNVSLDEREHTKLFEYDNNIIKIYSNYGASINPSFVVEPKIKSNRGRKPKESKLKRKPQGSGKAFNSQISFVVRADPTRNQQYNIKVFRDGVFCVSGGEGINYINDVIVCLKLVAAKLHTTFKNPPETTINIDRLQVCMKNYKCCIKLEGKQIINIINLKNLLYPDEQIADIKLDVENSLLTITFKYNEKNNIKVKIFPNSGKINILGSKDYKRVVEIYEYIADFIDKNKKLIIVTPGEKVEFIRPTLEMREREIELSDNLKRDIEGPAEFIDLSTL